MTNMNHQKFVERMLEKSGKSGHDAEYSTWQAKKPLQYCVTCAATEPSVTRKMVNDLNEIARQGTPRFTSTAMEILASSESATAQRLALRHVALEPA